MRVAGPGSLLPWLLLVAGLAALVPFARFEARHDEPMVDVRLLATPGQWPVQLTAFLFGMSVLGAQIPLSTFARTDPDVVGYGLGADASFVSTLIGVYVVFLAIGAFTLPLTTRLLGPRGALVGCGAAGRGRLRAVAAVPRLDRPGPAQHGRRRASARAPWSPRCRPRPRPPLRPTAPASRPA